MGVLAWIGAIVGILGGGAGLRAAIVTARDRGSQRRLRRRAIPRELAALEAEHRAFLQVSKRNEKDEVDRIRDEHSARGTLHSSFREKEQEKARQDARREREEAVRNYDLRKAALEDELQELGGPGDGAG